MNQSIVACVVLSLLGFGGAAAGTTEEAADHPSSLSPESPIVRVVSPANGGAFVMEGGERRLLVVIEVIDVEGSGIVSEENGLPRFLDPNANVRAFLSHVTGQYRYVDGYNRSIVQIVSDIPVAKLVPEKGWSLTAPVDWKSASPAWKKHGVSYPPGPTVNFAAFWFRVKDRRGIASEEKKMDPRQSLAFPDLTVGFATAAYVPEGEPPSDDEPLGKEISDKDEDKN